MPSLSHTSIHLPSPMAAVKNMEVILIRMAAASLLLVVSTPAFSTPIYKCKDDATGRFVFQSTACTANTLDNLADTYTSKIFAREEAMRQERIRLKEEDKRRKADERDAKIKAKEIERQKFIDSIAEDPQRKIDREKWGLAFDPEKELRLQEIDKKKNMLSLFLNDPELKGDCSPFIIQETSVGMSMGAFEDVVGPPSHEQIFGNNHFYYYNATCNGQRLKLQVEYQGYSLKNMSVY